MSGSSNSSKWDDLLKHGSAIGIIKPDVVFTSYGGSSSSGSSSGSSGSSGNSGSSSAAKK